MKRKNMMIASGILAVALVISSMPANYARAGVKNAKVTTVKKKAATKKKTTVVVNTASELNKALKNSANTEISLKTNKKVKLNLKGNHNKVKLVIDAPKAEVANKGRFKIIEIGSKKWVEKANGNGLVVKSKESSIEVSKNAKVAFIRFLKSGAKADVSIKGEVTSLVVEKKAELSLSGKTDLVPVTVNAEGTKVKSSVQVELIANKNTETIFKKGAEGSSVKATNDETKVVVKNETKEEVFVENASGDETVLMSGAYKELKNGVLADKGGYENSLDNTVSLNDETTPLGDAKKDEIATNAAIVTATEAAVEYVIGSSSTYDENKYAPIEDKLLLKVINKNIDKNRPDDQRVTKEEMAGLKVLSIFLGADGKPEVSQGNEFLTKEDKNGGQASKPKESILGTPKNLTRTPDFKFAVSRGIKSIKGLEYAVNLEKLKLNENEISDISPLKNLKKLEYIELQRNRIVDIRPLKELTELKYLKLYNNLIEDVTPLAGLTKLKGLDLHYNVTVTGDELHKTASKGITDVSSVLDNMKELEFLDLSANRITEVKGLEKLDKIKDLDLSDNRISDYTGLGDYLASRYANMLSGNGSVNFSGQNVDNTKEITVENGVAEFESPYNGMAELSNSIVTALMSDEEGEDAVDIFMFSNVIVDKYNEGGITAQYNKDTNKIKLMVTDKIADAHRADGLTISVAIRDLEDSMQWKINNVKLKFPEKSEPKLEANGKVYRKYDLREVKAVSKIKNQFRDGGCRSFAALGALESHIKLKTGVELDLSENNFENRHGFYFGTNNVRQGRNRNSDIPYLVNYGPILEEDDPYIPMKGEGGEGNYLTQEQVNAAAKNPVIKDGVKQIMGFDFLKTVDTTKVRSAEDDELLQIKEAIAKNGGVVADMYMAHDGNKTFPYTDVKYYNPETKAYYFDGKGSDRTSKYKTEEADGVKYGANHAITIVGWDDDFSKDNFTTKPEIDGAWIVRDAQSEAFGDKGYFYVSFQSVSMGENPYVFTEVIEPQYSIYQHDEFALTGYRRGINFDTDEKDVLFNRYKAESDSKIEKIGFYTTKKNAEYEVYFIPDFAELEEKAKEIGEDEPEAFYTMIQDYKVLSGSAKSAGYHTLDIPADKAINLTKGKDFAVGIWTRNSDAEDPDHKYDMVVEEKNIMGQGKNAKVGKKETYIYDKERGFMDFNQFTFANGPAYPMNACIKAYYKR